MNTVISSILLLGWLRLVGSASSGAKDSACQEMYPAHSGQKQTTPPPFKILMTSSHYGCGASAITVTIKANDLDGFKGFLCQPRTDVNVYKTFGTFEALSDSITNNCDMEAAATHTEPSLKTSVSFSWVPPDQDIGTVHIVCTVVKNWTIFWHKVPSEGIQYTDSCSSSTAPPTQLSTNYTTASSTTTTTTNTTINSTRTTPKPTTNPISSDSTSSSTSENNVSTRTSSVPSTTPSLSTEKQTITPSTTVISNITYSTSTQASTGRTNVTFESSTLSSRRPSTLPTTVNTVSSDAGSSIIRAIHALPFTSIFICYLLHNLRYSCSL